MNYYSAIKKEWSNAIYSNMDGPVIVQSLSWVLLFVAPWTTVPQASLSFTISWSLLKFFELMRLSNHLILCHPLLLPSIFSSIRVFSNGSALCIRWQSIGVSASASVLPMNIQGWFPLGLTGLILLSRDSHESSPAPQFKKKQYSNTQKCFSPTFHFGINCWHKESMNILKLQ